MLGKDRDIFPSTTVVRAASYAVGTGLCAC